MRLSPDWMRPQAVLCAALAITGALAVSTPAFGQETAAVEPEKTEEAAEAKEDADEQPNASATGNIAGGGETSLDQPLFEFNAGELAVLRRLAARRQELDAREAALVERERLIAALEAKLVQQSIELKKVRAALADQEERMRKEQETVDTAAVDRVKGLAKAYKSMKPKDAARLFDKMDMGLLIRIAREISPRTLAPVMAKMQADKARELSLALTKK